MTDAFDVIFYVDSTTLRLGKWLRYLGLDVRIASSCRGAVTDGVLLTKMRRGLKKNERIFFVPFDRIEDQLKWFAVHFKSVINARKVGSRCIRCNELLQPVEREAVRDCVPDYVYQTHLSFKICPGCRKIYWKGSHPERMEAFLQKAGLQVGGRL